ncbi:MAG TPA: hypothetical protein VK151_19000 [Fluviicola sp.]|nr:hypothetical protein [Fluviicola sp.]
MEYKFLTYSFLERIFENGEKELVGKENFHIGSISDFLYVPEMYKKGQLNLSPSSFTIGHELINDKINSGLFYLQELDHELLKANLFNDSDLDLSIATDKISPRRSITRTVLKLSPNSFWDENIIDEMEEWYDSAE